MIIFCTVSILAILCNFRIAGISTYTESHSADVFGFSMSNYVMNHVVQLLAYISLWEAFTQFISGDFVAFICLLLDRKSVV